MKLTKDLLIKEAELFCARANSIEHPELLGINDGKTVGTYIEHEFKKYLKSKYEFGLGSSSFGIDFPDENINTDLKVTSLNKPQNSCTFRDIKQKIYGLGYNLLLFIYEKSEKNDKCYLYFDSCTFIKSSETGDYNLTMNLRKMVENGWDKEKIAYYLGECNLPRDELTLNSLAEEIINNPPNQGYLTISPAFQWRIKYTHKEKNIDLPKVNSKKEYGDYQTPLDFAMKVLEVAVDKYNLSPDLIIEPTCGVGNFIKASMNFFKEVPIVGIDINNDYLEVVKKEFPNVHLFNENVFDYDFTSLIKSETDEYLIIGNPPWITNTRLSKYSSDNFPMKNNIKNLDFFSATTGKSNFDVSENIILQIINQFKNLNTKMIFLCKYIVACNIFKYLVDNQITSATIEIIKFDAMKVFKADTSSCVLIIDFNNDTNVLTSCVVSNFNDSEIYRIGVMDGKFYSNLDNVINIDGACCFEWRQGIKHDCNKIMELEKEGDYYHNNKGDSVMLEDDLLYPLLKSSNLKEAVVSSSQKSIIITQHKLKEDTSYIKEEYPLVWNYLINNRDYFSNRKSNIYNNAPEFSIFGIGDYTFKKYKVAISGFYKKGLFCLVHNKKSMMLDDTCYYLSFDDYDSAYITMLILNSWVVKAFLKSVVSLDSKRPYTKSVLKRIDLSKALKLLDYNDLLETENELGLDSYIDEKMFNDYLINYKKNSF